MLISPCLSVKEVTVTFRRRVPKPFWTLFPSYEHMEAVSRVSLDVYPGEIVGVIGESGCGKSTLLRSILGRITPDSGEILWMGRSIQEFSQRELAKSVQMVFQDSLSAMNPRQTAYEIISEPLDILCKKEFAPVQRVDRVFEVMEQVGLPPKFANCYPHQFSGGQAQRVAIARALVSSPKLLLCDEPVAALDVSIQAQILNLLLDLNERLKVAMLFISHDLGVVRRLADRVVLLYLGQVVEKGPAPLLYENPKHPYMEGLLGCVPTLDADEAQVGQLAGLKGEIPSAFNPPSGCVFHPRCPYATAACRERVPQLETTEDGREIRCLRHTEPEWDERQHRVPGALRAAKGV